MIIEHDIKLDFSDVLIRPKRSALSSRNDVDLIRSFTFKHSKQTWNGIPIMAANMDGVGTFNVASELGNKELFTCLVKSYTANEFDSTFINPIINHVAVSTGTGDKDYANLINVLYHFPEIKFICIDVANGYSEHFGNFIEKIRNEFTNKTIIAGNVVTADMTQELILRGADIVKIGIGPGSVCTTRIQTGVGYPQLSAVIECADAAHGLGAHIISDGGCSSSGDIAKAFGGGADFVMLGGMLAGHDEGGGEIITETFMTNKTAPNTFTTPLHIEKQFIEFYGMSSETAQNKHGGIKTYRASEGRTVRIPYKGSIADTVEEILGGIRSCCTYVGADQLKHLSKCTTFIRVNNTHNRSFEQNTVGK